MSGPVSGGEVVPAGSTDAGPAVELLEGRRAEVGGLPVTRLLPKRTRRTIGAWCFLDHFGPADAAMAVGPHPHIGLATVTWVLSGEVLHRDSLGSEQLIRPGQLNLMTAGHGVAHAEEAPSQALHGLQLWVALPEATRHGAAAFEHHATLPQVELGEVVATVLLGAVGGTRSPARADTPLLGAELELHGAGVLPLDPAHEHGIVCVSGDLSVEGVRVAPGQLAHLGSGRAELAVEGSGRALLLGGEPFEATLEMSWNFVGRSREELARAHDDWNAGDARFGAVASPLERIPAPPLR